MLEVNYGVTAFDMQFAQATLLSCIDVTIICFDKPDRNSQLREMRERLLHASA